MSNVQNINSNRFHKMDRFNKQLFCTILLLAILGCMPVQAHADKINCAKVEHPLKCLLKYNNRLKMLDKKLVEVYQSRLEKLNLQSKLEQKTTQDYWLDSLESQCKIYPGNPYSSSRSAEVIKCLTDLYSARIKSFSRYCDVDKKFSVDEIFNSNKKWLNKVPADFEVDNRVIDFVIRPKDGIITDLYSLPILSNETKSAYLHDGVMDTATCRVQGADGIWWLAQVIGNKTIEYVLESETVTLLEYDKQSEKKFKANPGGMR